MLKTPSWLHQSWLQRDKPTLPQLCAYIVDQPLRASQRAAMMEKVFGRALELWPIGFKPPRTSLTFSIAAHLLGRRYACLAERGAYAPRVPALCAYVLLPFFLTLISLNAWGFLLQPSSLDTQMQAFKYPRLDTSTSPHGLPDRVWKGLFNFLLLLPHLCKI